MTDDIINDPDFIKWAKDVETNLIPKLDVSPLTVSLVPNGPADIKYAVELGLSLMMDKPIILAVNPGVTLPAKLVKVADEIVEIDLSTDETRDRSALRMREAMDRVVERLNL